MIHIPDAFRLAKAGMGGIDELAGPEPAARLCAVCSGPVADLRDTHCSITCMVLDLAGEKQRGGSDERL